MEQNKKNSDMIYVFFMAIIVSLLGWIIESLSQFITHGVIDSRYYVLPFIASYGLIPIIWYFINNASPELLDYRDKPLKFKIIYNIILFTLLSLAVFIIEIIYGNAVEYLFSVKLWDYSDIPFCVTQYAGLITSLAFGLVAWILIKIFPKWLEYLKENSNRKFLYYFDIILGSLIILDEIMFYINLIVYHRTIIYWKIL